MDIVLEVTDTFVMDHIYAALFPARPVPYDFPNSSLANDSAAAFSTWEYRPSTKYLNLEPSPAAYMSSLPRDNIYRQAVSLWLIAWLFGCVIYFVFASLSYLFVFDKRILNHPKFVKNQVKLEIQLSLWAMPFLALWTAPFFLIEVRGFSKLYDAASDAPFWWYNVVQFPLFLVFTDFSIYWIHRGSHHPRIYKHLHKAHHKWIMPTPFASHAFHPLDSFAQGLPYHIFPLLFPLQKLAYIALFVFVNIWSIMIHDGEFLTNNPVVNGAACHMLHHSHFEVNYGQFFTFVDRLGGTYRKPEAWMFNRELKMSTSQWKSQDKEVNEKLSVLEVQADRYHADATKKTD